LQYRHNYQLHFLCSAEKGIDHIEWLNFIAFINKLDAAITEQQQTVLYAQNKSREGGNEFLSCQRKLKSYDTLSQRQHNEENQRQLKLEQKVQDEFASNSSHRDSFLRKGG